MPMNTDDLYRKDSFTRMIADEYEQALHEQERPLSSAEWRERVGLWERDEANRLPLPEYLAAFS